MKPQHFFYFLAAFAFLFSACEKNPPVKKELLSGYAQKGPFVNGASVTIAELNTRFNQTGKTYHTIISDNLGSFELNNIELVSQYVELKADGFYFNEFSGQISSAPMALYALADIKDVNSVNVNVLTHLEKPRVEYLIKQQGLSFTAAKQQAQNEVLAIFGFTPQETSSEALSLTSDAKLLAISCILQGRLSTGDMMELLAQISTDIKQDGKLDNMTLGSKLLTQAMSINLSLAAIRDNLIKKYAELGVNVTIPDFESYVQSFINSGLYPQTAFITYPESGGSHNKYNILSDKITEVKPLVVPYYMNEYSFCADVPEGQGVKIILKGGVWRGPNEHSEYYWDCSDYDEINKTQEFTTKGSGGIQYSSITFSSGTLDENNQEYIMVEYYENGAITPTKVKRLNIMPNKK